MQDGKLCKNGRHYQILHSHLSQSACKLKSMAQKTSDWLNYKNLFCNFGFMELFSTNSKNGTFQKTNIYFFYTTLVSKFEREKSSIPLFLPKKQGFSLFSELNISVSVAFNDRLCNPVLIKCYKWSKTAILMEKATSRAILWASDHKEQQAERQEWQVHRKLLVSPGICNRLTYCILFFTNFKLYRLFLC